MLAPIDPNTPPTTVRHLSVSVKKTSSAPEKCDVLLVEPAMIPRSDRERILTAADYCVTAVSNVREMFDLRFEKPVAFAVLNDLLGFYGLRAAAESVRRQWPFAKILVIGCAAPTLDDQLYDETISHRHEVTGFLEAIQVLTKDSLSQKVIGGYAGYRRAATSLEESDPTKIVDRTLVQTASPHNMPMGLHRMRPTG